MDQRSSVSIGIALSVVLLGLLPTPATGQHELPLLVTTFHPSDYGLERAGDVRRGRVSVAYTASMAPRAQAARITPSAVP